MHWSELQFRRFRETNVEDPAAAVAAGAHWLAAEYVVLEGYRELGLQDKRISALLSLYPENGEALRRCRNAVYHFQSRPLDSRLTTFLKDEREELRWTTAVHFEFQGLMIRVVASISHRGADGDQVAAAVQGGIGWFPEHPLAPEINRLHAMHAETTQITAGDQSEAAEVLRTAAAQALAIIDAMDMYPLSTSLSRMVGRSTPNRLDV